MPELWGTGQLQAQRMAQGSVQGIDRESAEATEAVLVARAQALRAKATSP